MKFTQSLKKNYQFRLVYNRGKSLANRLLVLYVLENGLEYNRLGVSVSKKVGKSVVRSRVSRLIKESYRLSENSLLRGVDIIFIARVNAKDASFFDVSKSSAQLMKKHNIFNSDLEK